MNSNKQFEKLEEYYKINSPADVRNQIKKNEKIFMLLEEVKPYLEESFKGCEFCLEKNFEPEMDDEFIILRVNVSEERFNNGIGEEIILFDRKTKSLWQKFNICRELIVMPGIKDV